MRSLAALLAVIVGGAVAATEGPGLGIEADPHVVAAWDTDVGPDGAGLPPGSGTALEGATVYARHCLACHGTDGTGGVNDVLVGGHGSLDGPDPLKTIGSFWPFAPTLFDYLRRAMPYLTPRSLSDDEVYALTAYLLFLNGIIGAEQPMDARSLADVRMPNRDNFIPAHPAMRGERSRSQVPE